MFSTWLPYAGIAAGIIIIAIGFTKKLGEEYAWVNRKIIHFSITPAIILYYTERIPKEVFALAALAFALAQLIPHLKREELSWYQINNNYGEVFFALSASFVVAFLPKKYATAVLLVMAISDGITGILRFYYFRKNGYNVKLKKHWSGSLGYFLTAFLIAFLVFPEKSFAIKLIWSGILTLAEYQKFLDDNLAVPLVAAFLYPVV
ncbi:hypothetical protein DRN34_01425 [Thermococci archaeon]|nr:MAG: hypothetical protein DRN34_01425 [Thermococci archaeon]